MVKCMKIIQLLPTISYGDAVGNDTMAMHEAMCDFGYRTEIYAENIDSRRNENFIHHYTELPELNNDDLLIYHFSTGSEQMVKILRSTSCRKIMVYHNITPAKYFKEYDKFTADLVENGRRELMALKDAFEACICDSAYNMKELQNLGYRCPMKVLPILIPFSDYDREADANIISKYEKDEYINFLFVGRVAPNKKQEDVIRAFTYYHKNINAKSRLFIVGSATGKYAQRLHKYIEKLDMKKSIVMTGAISFKEILAYYNVADIFLCMSEHEGFCVPLVEAMYFQIPVIAYAMAAVPETMGSGTGLIDDKSPAYVANCVEALLRNAQRKETVINAQNKCLERFENASLKNKFSAMLSSFIKKDYQSFVQYDTSEYTKSYFSDFDIKGKGDFGGIQELNSIPMPKENNSWRKIVKYRVLKPAYNTVSTCSPWLAEQIRNRIYGAYYQWRDRNKVSFSQWQRPFNEPYIFVDTTQISHCDEKTGIQRVVNQVLCNMAERDKSVMAVKDYNNKLMTSFEYMSRHGLSELKDEELVTFQRGDKLLLLDSSWEYDTQMKNTINSIRSTSGKVGAVVYDLFPVQYPELFSNKSFVNIFIKWHQMIISEADDIICISRTTADNVEKYYLQLGFKRKTPLRLHYFPMGAKFTDVQGIPRAILSDFVIEGNTFLMVGTIEPRKGHAVAIEAFTKLVETNGDARLLLIGKNGWKNEDIIKLINQESLQGKILWLKDADDAELQWAYKHASALIAASKDEGFGLPLIEAAHYGIPIIASDIPIFHEVAGEYADYFKAMDSDDLCNVLIKWLATDVHPNSKKIRLYTWQESAQVILDIMNHKQDPYKILQ